RAVARRHTSEDTDMRQASICVATVGTPHPQPGPRLAPGEAVAMQRTALERAKRRAAEERTPMKTAGVGTVVRPAAVPDSREPMVPAVDDTFDESLWRALAMVPVGCLLI